MASSVACHSGSFNASNSKPRQAERREAVDQTGYTRGEEGDEVEDGEGVEMGFPGGIAE